MSKVNAMQAIREARYAARVSNKAAGPTARAVEAASQVETGSPRPITPSDTPPAAEVVVTELFPAPALSGTVASSGSASSEITANSEPAEAEALCGHRSMNNRNCRRPAGHAEKNHRYN